MSISLGVIHSVGGALLIRATLSSTMDDGEECD